MKTLLLILGILAGASLHAKSELRAVFPYTVISDTPKSDVPTGYCRVKGTVRSSGTPLPNGTIGNYGMSIRTTTDSLGNYEMLIPDSDSIIFFFAIYHLEIVTQPYDFKSGHEVVIDFNTYYHHEVLEVDKPVIYLYSEKEINVNIELDFAGDLSFTYPEYDSEWHVKVDETGITEMNTNQSFPYLFWEGEIEAPQIYTKCRPYDGFVVAQNEVVSFLEQQLTSLGLNEREQTDFITFWAPQMVQSNFVFVHFIVDEAYDELIAGISIDPKPDNLRRVYMVFTPFEVKPEFNVVPQAFDSFDRNGFSVLEWGGSKMSLGQIFQ